MDEERKLRRREEKQLKLRDAFMAQDVHPEVFERVNQAVYNRRAARGTSDPGDDVSGSWCSGMGRRINIGDPEWPSTLQGDLRGRASLSDKELRPWLQSVCGDHQLPGGMPGDVGLTPQVVALRPGRSSTVITDQ